MINAAIIGLGWWGKNLAKSVQGSSKIRFSLGVTKEIDQATSEFAKIQGISLKSEFEDALQEKSIQAVVLATPHTLHAEQIIAAAKAGKHVFCEKPLALTHEDAKQAIAACQEYGVTLAVGQNKRFWPSMVKLREVIQSNVLGEILHLEGHYSNEHSTKFFSQWRDLPEESPAGGLTGTGIHIIDAFVNIAGPAQEVSAMVSSMRTGKDPRDATSVSVRFKNGVSGYFAMVRATPIFWRVHVFGDEASVEALGENEVVIRYRGGRTERFINPAIDSVCTELEAFAIAIPTPERAAIPYPISLKEMGNAISLFEAIVASVNSQTMVKVK